MHPLGGLEMSILDPKCSGMTCKNVLPAEGGKHFFILGDEKGDFFEKWRTIGFMSAPYRP